MGERSCGTDSLLAQLLHDIWSAIAVTWSVCIDVEYGLIASHQYPVQANFAPLFPYFCLTSSTHFGTKGSDCIGCQLFVCFRVSLGLRMLDASRATLQSRSPGWHLDQWDWSSACTQDPK